MTTCVRDGPQIKSELNRCPSTMCCRWDKTLVLSHPKVFWKYFPEWLNILKEIFTRLMRVHIYAKLLNFIQLSPTVTKSCHIKRNHLQNFLHFSRKKHEKLKEGEEYGWFQLDFCIFLYCIAYNFSFPGNRVLVKNTNNVISKRSNQQQRNCQHWVRMSSSITEQ